MKSWILALIGLGILDCFIRVNDRCRFNIGWIYRLIVFIICCIWG